MKIKFLNSTQGVGKQSKRAWYRIQFVATAENGAMVAVDKFVSETVFNQFQTIQPGKDVVIEIGVDSRGEFTVVGVVDGVESEIF